MFQFKKKNTIDFDMLFETYNSYVYKIVKNESDNKLTKEDIEETVSDIFFLLWKHYSSIKDQGKIKSYIGVIAKNTTRNKLRNVKQEISFEEHDWLIGKNEEESYHVSEQLKIVQEELQELSIEDREIFLMYYYDNRKIKEIADEKDMNESTVKTRLRRAKKKLRKSLEKVGFKYE